MTKVICSKCGNEYKSKIPKGGDGSILFPYKHNKPEHDFLGVLEKQVCDGSYLPAKEVIDE